MDQGLIGISGGGAVDCRSEERPWPSMFQVAIAVPDQPYAPPEQPGLDGSKASRSCAVEPTSAGQGEHEARCCRAQEIVAGLIVALPSGATAAVHLRWDLVAIALAKGADVTRERLQMDLQGHADRLATWPDTTGDPKQIESEARHLVEAALANVAERGELWQHDGTMSRTLDDALWRYECLIGIVDPVSIEEAANAALDRIAYPEMLRTMTSVEGIATSAWIEDDAIRFVEAVTGLPSATCARFVEIHG